MDWADAVIPSRCPSCHAVARHLTTCTRDRWRGRRVPDVNPGRPSVIKRSGRWFVFTVEQGVVGIERGSGEANDLARFWAVAYFGYEGAKR